MTPAEIIKIVINTLNQVEVKGESNISKLLGCIGALNQLMETFNNPAGQEAPTPAAAEQPEQK